MAAPLAIIPKGVPACMHSPAFPALTYANIVTIHTSTIPVFKSLGYLVTLMLVMLKMNYQTHQMMNAENDIHLALGLESRSTCFLF